MFTREFAIDAATRAVKTIAQTLLATLALGSTLWGVDWMEAIGIALLAGLISVLTSIADPKVDGGGYVGQHRAEWAPVDGED